MQKIQSFKDDSRYAYAVGRIRVLETRLLDSTVIQRMLEADSPQAALDALANTEYETPLSKIESESDFEVALRGEMERIYALADKLTQDKELTDIFRIKWDFHNLKVLLKQKYLQSITDIQKHPTDVSDILVQSGLEDLDELKEAVMSEDGKSRRRLPQYLQEAIAEVESEFEVEIDPQLIDIVLDKHTQVLNYQRASKYSRFLQNYFLISIDLHNIKSLLRVKILCQSPRSRLSQRGAGGDFLRKVLLDNGRCTRKEVHPTPELFLNQFEESIPNFAGSIKQTDYYELVAAGIQSWTENHSLGVLEKLADNYLLNYLKQAKYAILGVEPLLSYLLAKEHEIKLIRIIMIGKLNGLPSASIRERLRETYV